jgi:hypothetical protein
MTLPTWSTVFVDDVSPIPAAFLNGYVRTQIPRALDGVGGGSYSLAAPLVLGGDVLRLADGNRLNYNSRNIPRKQSMIASTTSGNWSRTITPRGAWQNTASGGTLDIALDRLAHGQVLQTVTVRWQAASGHGALPSLPSIELFRIADDGTSTSLGSQTDTSASVVAYETVHNITLGGSGLGHTIDLESWHYVLVVTGETGANFVANAKPIQCSTLITVTSQPEY